MTSNLKQGDLVIAPMPYTNLQGLKRRPAVVLRSIGDDVIVCQVTSKTIFRKHTIPLSDTDLVYGRLAARSTIKVHALFTLDQAILGKRFAQLRHTVFNRVRDEFKALV